MPHTTLETCGLDLKKIYLYLPNLVALGQISDILRKEHDYIKKVEPLKRALEGYDVWITGIRAEQSPHRQQMPMVEWDEGNKIIKFHPLLHWKTGELLPFLKEHKIPYNPLHEQGYVSIGDQPMTRPIKEGEDIRAGRWWWENEEKKECGLHWNEDKK